MSGDASPDIAALVKGLTKAQRVVAMRCGDVADRFPCGLCGARVHKDCGVSMSNRRIICEAIEDAKVIVNGSGLDALRVTLKETPDAE